MTLLKDQEFGDALVDVATSEKRLVRVTTNTYQSSGGTYITIKMFKRERWSGQFLYATKGSPDCQGISTFDGKYREYTIRTCELWRRNEGEEVKQASQRKQSGCAREEKAKRPRNERQLNSKPFWSHDFLHIAVFCFFRSLYSV